VSYKITPLTRVDALEILNWRYPFPYDFYDPPFVEDTTAFAEQLLRNELHFHGIWDDANSFVGFCSYGWDGQVMGGDYSEPGLDIGLGMKPELIDKGRGNQFLESILNFAFKNFKSILIRITVANFNHRALFLYEKFGFTLKQQFIDPDNGMSYSILVLEKGDFSLVCSAINSYSARNNNNTG